MLKPMLGHLDPEFHGIVDDVAQMLAAIYQREHDGATFALSATGTGGLEAGLAALAGYGDKVIVGTAGFFGDRIVELARRRGAEVVEVRAPPGQHVRTEAFLDAVKSHPDAVLIALVHADTSTGVRQPVAELSEALGDRDQLLLIDCVTSLGGIEVDADRWSADYCFSCTQKCLGAPPGLSPISVSERALEQMRTRRRESPFYFDLDRLVDYWLERPARYHHTLPILSIYALHAALEDVLSEGLGPRWQRHAEAGGYLQAELERRGFELLAESGHRLPQLTAVRVPDRVDGVAVQRALVKRHGIEIGGQLGASGPAIWRIGLMGVNATRESADRVLDALDETLAGHRAETAPVA
jgi:alanine-glyoxylate transaminase/serine-glyoxylate transaminase/serine-pyruvate transaminase